METTTPEEELSSFQRHQGQKHVLLSAALNNVANLILFNSVMMLYANDVFGFPPDRISSILAIVPLVNIFRVVMIQPVRRIGLTRTLKASTAIRMLVVLAMLLLPLPWITYYVFLGLVFIYMTVTYLGVSLVWQPLIRNITTVDDRGGFFARMRFTFSLSTTIFTFCLPFFIGEKVTEFQYRILILIALIGNINFLYWGNRIPDLPVNPDENDKGLINAERLKQIFKTAPLLRRPLLIHSLIIFSMFPVYVLYLRTMLNMPSQIVALFITSLTFGATVSFLLWGKIADTIGFRPMLIGMVIIAILLVPLQFLLVPFSPDHASWSSFTYPEFISAVMVVVIGFASGTTGAGTGIAITSIQHFFVKKDEAIETMNIYFVLVLAFTSVITFISGVILQKLAIPFGSQPFFNGILHFDLVKGFLLFVAVPLKIIAIWQICKISNSQDYFGVLDFFNSLTFNSIRNIFAQRLVYHEEEDKRQHTAFWFGRTSNPISISSLKEMANDPSYDVKVEAIRSLGRSNSKVAGEFLLSMLNDESKRQIADHIAWALGELRYEEAFDALVTHLGPFYAIRIRAMSARALGKLGDNRAIPHLIELLRSEEKSQHLLSSTCRALIRLEIEHARLIFTTLNKLTDRMELYELMDPLCNYLNIPNKWFLENQIPEKSAADTMQDFLNNQSDAWQEARSEVISLFQKRDFHGIEEKIRQKQQDSDIPEHNVIAGLAASLASCDRWTPSHLMAVAWLLFNEE